MATNLPPEIIVDILSRLPVKSLQRFRCVSKWCRYLIDSQDFALLHLNRSNFSYSNPTLILGFLGIYSVDLDSLDVAYPLNPPFSSSDVTNSCNGLVLVSMQRQSPFLWNPLTRKYKTLPYVPVEYPQGTDSTAAYTRYGFGYDSHSHDYKVVRAVEFRGPDFGWIGTEAKIFSLKSNSWSKIPDFHYRIPRTRDWAVHVNDALHTIVYLADDSNPSILAFDLTTEKTHIVPKPDMLVSTGHIKLHALGGSLCLLNPFKKYGSEIWIMKEYGVKQSWTHLLSIAPPKIEPYTSLAPVTYSKSGNEVLLNLNEEKLVWYDLKRETTRGVTTRGLPFRFYANLLIGSLISPDLYDRGNELNNPPNHNAYPNQQDKRNVKIRRKRNDFLSKGFNLVL